MNNQSIFHTRAQQRSADKFSSYDTNETQDEPAEISRENIFKKRAQNKTVAKEKELGILGTLRDVGEQALTRGVSGAVGAYGNILDAFGLDTKQQLPGEIAQNRNDFQTLEKLDRGEIPTLSEIEDLSSDMIAPRRIQVPTSKDVQEQIKQVTGIGEGKSNLGRVAGRGSELAGEAVATGGGLRALFGTGLSGTLGQIVREAGGPEALASGIEIAGSLGSGLVEGKLAPKASQKALVEGARKIGMTEKQIAPLIQGESKLNALSKVARKGAKTKERFAEIKDVLGNHRQALKSMPIAKQSIPDKQKLDLWTDFIEIQEELAKTLKPSEGKKGAIKFIKGAVKSLEGSKKSLNLESLLNFWEDINKSVKWNSIDGGKKALSQLKQPILNTLKKVSPEIAEAFDINNQLYSKYARVAKKLKPDVIDSFLNKGEVLSLVPAGWSLAHGNIAPFAALATESAFRSLSTEMLTNPYFQNLSRKLVKNFNQGSQVGVTKLVNQAKEYLQDKFPNEKWDFLDKVDLD